MGNPTIKLNPKAIKPDVTRFKLGDTTVKVEKYEYSKQQTGITYINLHENERTSVKAAQAVLNHVRYGRLLKLVSGGKRLVTFKVKGRKYKIDPNRIFTDKGIKKTLRTHGRYSKAAHRAVKQFVDKFLKKYKLRKSVAIITLHNNTNRGSLTIQRLKKRMKKGDQAYINKKADGDDFFYVTSQWFYQLFKGYGFNTFFKNLGRVKDDGSLSVFCKKNIIPYMNVEAQHGHLRQQVSMLYYAWHVGNIYHLAGYLGKMDQGVRTYVGRGIYWAKKKKYHRALAYFTRAIMQKPKGLWGALAHMSLANVLLALKKPKKALVHYNKAVDLYKKKDIVFFNRGIYFYKQKQYKKAEADFSKAISLNSQNWLARYNRGTVRLKLGKKVEAKADFKKACQLNKALCP